MYTIKLLQGTATIVEFTLAIDGKFYVATAQPLRFKSLRELKSKIESLNLKGSVYAKRQGSDLYRAI